MIWISIDYSVDWLEKEGSSSTLWYMAVCVFVYKTFSLSHLSLFVEIERFSEQILPLTHTNALSAHTSKSVLFALIWLFSLLSHDISAHTHTHKHTFVSLENKCVYPFKSQWLHVKHILFLIYWIIYTVVSHRQVLNELGLWKKPSNKSNKFTCYNNDSLDRE